MKRSRILFPLMLVALAGSLVLLAAPSAPRVARVWRGEVATANADRYAALLDEKGIEVLKKIPGNRGAEMWRRAEGDRTEFVVISYWESKEAIKNFTGPDWEKVKPLPEDAGYILAPGATVTHYEVVKPLVP